jgi:hypothetical protein
MSTATATVTYDAELIASARETFTRARSLDWPETDRILIGETVRDLAGALLRHRRLRCGMVPAFFPGMPAGKGALARCLKGAAEEAQEIADHLVILLPACGTEGSGES